MPRRRSKTVGVVALLLLAASVASGERQPAEPVSEPSTPTSDPEAALTGDEIYKRVLENRFDKYDQTLRMRSGDRSGQAQETLLHVSYMSFREKSDKILSKTIAKYFEPQDVRHLGYLVVNKKEGADDQFIYRPSARRVRRVNLRGEAVFGTDFSFEDIIPQEYEDATYRRLPDEIVAEIDCFSVEVTPTAKAESEYSRFIVRVHKQHYLPIETWYWDEHDVHSKTLTADPESMTRYEVEQKQGVKQVWIARHSKIVNLKFESFTELDVVEFEANPKLTAKDFSERKLTASR